MLTILTLLALSQIRIECIHGDHTDIVGFRNDHRPILLNREYSPMVGSTVPTILFPASRESGIKHPLNHHSQHKLPNGYSYGYKQRPHRTHSKSKGYIQR